MKIRNSLFLLIILLSTSNSKLYATVQASDSLRIEQYLKHIYSLEHIIRNTDNSRFFVEISDEFCYSTLAIDANNNVAQKYLHKNDLIKSTCAQKRKLSGPSLFIPIRYSPNGWASQMIQLSMHTIMLLANY